MKILIVEDEQNVVSFLQRGLVEQSYNVDVAYDGQSGLELALQNEYDAILLDILLPQVSGLEVCKRVREVSKVPILFLTALGSTKDIVAGLDLGADDYLTKPFKFQELLARIRALTRRKNEQAGESKFSIADLEVDYRTKQVKRENNSIKLTAREFYLLQYFIRNRGVVVSRADIAEHVWESSLDLGSNVVDVYVNYLRNKIDKDYKTKLIHTVYGMGYIFKDNSGDN